MAAPFYKGKTLNMIINFSAGARTDTEARLISRHLAQHIPGHPTSVVRNVVVAGDAPVRRLRLSHVHED